MNYKNITGLVVVISAFAFISFDIIIYALGGNAATISQVFLGFASSHPTLPWAWGGLTGHLAWPVTVPATGSERYVRIGILALTTTSLLICDATGILPSVPPVAVMLVGVVAGHYGWAQKDEQGIS
jgi:hypothetical protein